MNDKDPSVDRCTVEWKVTYINMLRLAMEIAKHMTKEQQKKEAEYWADRSMSEINTWKECGF